MNTFARLLISECRMVKRKSKPKITKKYLISVAEEARGGPPVSLTDEEIKEKLDMIASYGWRGIPFIFFGLFVFLAPILFLQNLGTASFAFFAAGVIAVVVGISYPVRARKISRDIIKNTLIKSTLAGVFDNLEYYPDRMISQEEIKNTSIIDDDWDEISGSDYVKGTYRGINVEFSDVFLEKIDEYVDSDGHTHTDRKKVFRGLWMICDFGKTLSTSLTLRERRGRGFIAKLSLVNAKSDVETENEEFNKKFSILTDSGHDAFYVLTPHMMEYILSTERFAGGHLFMEFVGSRVHIAIDLDTDFFEVDLHTRSLKKIAAMRARYKREITYITGIIDELRLSSKLFKGDE